MTAEPTERLPVGVMMPVLNSRAELPRHLDAMDEWLDGVSEVVVVDSFSSDGTLDLLRERLHHPRLKILDHPRGLYQSWNYGIRALKSDYFFVSTLGDTTTLRSIRRMYETAVSLETDVLIGAPVVQDQAGRATAKRWPVHEMIDDMGLSEGRRIDGWTWFAWALMYLPGTLIGSSASNLYRTEFMKAHPFPADYGRMGDSAWALEVSFLARFGVEPRAESTFWIHGAAGGPPPAYGATLGKFADLACRLLREQREAGNFPVSSIRRICDEFEARTDDFLRDFVADAEYRELKKDASVGAKVRALRLKLERARLRRETRDFRERSREALRNR